MGGACGEGSHHLLPFGQLLLDDIAGVGEVWGEHLLHSIQVALSVRFQEAPNQGFIVLFLRRHSSYLLLLANLPLSYGSAPSMMPLKGLLRIDWRVRKRPEDVESPWLLHRSNRSWIGHGRDPSRYAAVRWTLDS